MSEMVKLAGHRHPLVTNEHYKLCSQCGGGVREKCNYYCKICDAAWHIQCVPTLPEIYHPYHPHHALKLLTDGAPHYTDGKCHFCRNKLKDIVYHCYTCNFTLDLSCVRSPTEVTINKSSCHHHPLTLMARQVSFVCNVCGGQGERNPYVCVTCSFMVHKDCINRPHVININRHNHRISYTCSLGYGNRVCRVCRLSVDWMYGAYSCTRCPDFVVHSNCATDPHVWDGEELQGKPEEEEDEPMFIEVEANVIKHQMHPSHDLRLIEDGVVGDDSLRCQLCDGLVYYDKFYSCTECRYILHQICAYLPRRTRLGFSSHLVLLKEEFDGQFFQCQVCTQFATGYRYELPSASNSEATAVDLRCASINWWCDHKCHDHTLFLTNLVSDYCGVCRSVEYVLRCIDCKFNLCYKCASYPMKIKHRCDDHPLVLSFGDQEQHGTYWCTVCETKADPHKWFYECEECGIVCHIQCVLGDFTNVKPGLCTAQDGNKQGVVRNNSVTRPHCRYCGFRCLAPCIYSVFEDYFCSYTCFKPTPISLVSEGDPVKADIQKILNIVDGLFYSTRY